MPDVFDRKSYAMGYKKGEKDASVQELEKIATALEQIVDELKKGNRNAKRNRHLLQRK